MNNYLTKKVSYFTYQQLLNELEELKKKYYVIGYTVKSQENVADVQLVEKRKRKMEVVAKFLVDDEVDGVAPCSYLNNYLKRDRVNVPCDVGDCEDDCPFYSTANFVKWIKEPDRKVEVEDLKKPHQEDFTKYVNCSDALFDRDSYINALEEYCDNL